MAKDGKKEKTLSELEQAILKPTEAAEMAHVSKQAVYAWMREGRITTFYGGTLIYRPDFEKFLAAREIYTGGAGHSAVEARLR